MDLTLAVALLISAAIILFLFSLLSILYLKSHTCKNPIDIDQPLDNPLAKTNSIIKLKSSEVDALTSNFNPSTIIGEGGFSTVHLVPFKSYSFVAVKVLNVHRAFHQELDIVLRLNHPSIVKLIAYSDEKDQNILVFEYIPNGTLHDRILNCVIPLPWSKRITILYNVALALDYLHEGCGLQIIHGDIKSSNILLDENLEPKICDFGSAKMGFSAAITRSEKQMMGSLGYVDPHYLRTGSMSKKSEVYSFGVLIMELITGMEAFDPEKERLLTTVMAPVMGAEGEEIRIKRIKMKKFVDPKLGHEYDVDEVLAMTLLAARCVAEQPALRPSMAEVVKIMKENVGIVSSKGRVGV
ncbi:uncharacterized protein A4U43_C04F22350 [Asparagus officinalis]|uniref:Protein kinase domain-containing protein n=1 Tax=Asparagus officinalis TaxID=4686 RepID=A0A5P1F3H2_ASPOF|nr:probable receptor-like protein kinase At4g10390 [Asparagus officinalis]ONK72712.1 uncharacterized protein A4U43_C04F22350 [Asparagus officinalis]